jgi:two-component system sensor histidine kinase TctE
VDIPYAAFEGFEADAAERIFHVVFDPAGGLVTGYADLRPRHRPRTTAACAWSACRAKSHR